MKALTGSFTLGCVMTIALTGVSGCCSWMRSTFETDPPPDPSSYAAPVEAQPALAAARDRQINLFGELPDATGTPYFTRTTTSLLQHTYAQEGADFDPCLSRDGSTMVFASTRHNEQPDLYLKRTDGLAVTLLTADPAADIQPVFSPDGRKVAFASNRAGNWDIWVFTLGGGKPVQITSGTHDEIHPSWSPDGRQLVYCSLPSRGQWELWMVDAGSGGNRRFVGYGLFPEWSPVDDVILYQRARERGSRWFSIWTIELSNGEPSYPTEIASSGESALITPTWSADGTQIAYTAVTPDDSALVYDEFEGNLADIWIVDADGRNRVRLTDGFTANFSPAFAPEGRVFFTSARDGGETVWSLQPMGSGPGTARETASVRPPIRVQAASAPGSDG
jgi:TolB protein